MSYDVLGIILSDKCNLSCRHCCNDSGPKNSAIIDLPVVYDTIGEAARLGQFHEVGISGGEPFLFVGILKSIISYANARGLSSSVTTNAYWAVTETRARSVLDGLTALGLRSLNISASQFHFEQVSSARLVHAVRAALSLGLVTRVNCVSTRTFNVQSVMALLGPLGEQIQIVEMPCIPAGRAAQCIPDDEFLYAGGTPSGSCERHFTKLAVSVNGDVFPCCSPGGFTPPLRLGNVSNQSLQEIVQATSSNTLWHILRTLGPEFFVPFIAKKLGNNWLAPRMVDQCHLCNLIMSDPTLQVVVRDVIAQFERELAALKIDALSFFLGGARTEDASSAAVGAANVNKGEDLP